VIRRLLPILVLTRFALASTPPQTPVILEPSMELQALNGSDVHMVASQFSDADGDEHLCSDWEIRFEQEVVWFAPCAEGPEKLHIHLGDGVFSGTHTGATELRPESRFELRVRHRDDSGDASREWSGWAMRQFQTVLPPPVAALRLDDVLKVPAARWTSETGNVILPAGATLDLETVDRESLVHFTASGVVDAQPRTLTAIVRLRIASGADAWTLRQSELSFEDIDGDPHTIYLPSISLAAHSVAFYWISSNGGTHDATELDRTPDFTRIARGAPVPWSVARGFRADVFASGLELPVSLVAVPHPGAGTDDPFLYVAELYGSVKMVTRSGQVRPFASGLLNFDPRAPIPGNGERGLGGITIDPANGDVIVTGVYQTDPKSRWASPRILRLQSDDGGRTATRVTPILEFPSESLAPSHQISNVTVGPDGKLYVHVGSTFSWIAQDLNTIDGKILRINGDGSAPSDNPFYDAGNGITATDYIFAVGFRNPFGGAWRIADQTLYEVENGPLTDRLAQVIRGRNYGWDGTDPSMRIHALYNWDLPVAPIQIAFTEAERFDGSGFPSRKFRSAFVSESGPTWSTGPQKFGKRISEFVIDRSGSLVSGPTTFAEYDGSGKATAAGLMAGEDGLYFTDLYRDYGQSSPTDAGANVVRIQWIGFADFDPRHLSTSTVLFIDRSDVPNAESILWDFGDGTTSIERNPSHRYAEKGTYLVRQSVTGAGGMVTEAKRIFVGDHPTEVTAEYYESSDHPVPTVVRTERSLSFDWSESAPAPTLPRDGFAVRFHTTLTPRFSEDYRFTVQSRDRVRLSIDGTKLIDVFEPDGSGEHSATITLDAGRGYDLVVDYADRSAAPFLRVLWQSASQPTLVVPQSVPTGRRRAVSPP
jgi:glucose/arabinose dehydrogenase